MHIVRGYAAEGHYLAIARGLAACDKIMKRMTAYMGLTLRAKPIVASIGIGAIIGALTFSRQCSWLHSLLLPQEGEDYLDRTLNAPAFGAILGAVAALSLLLVKMKRPIVAAWFRMVVGFLVASFIFDFSIFAYWANHASGFEFTLQEM